MAKALTLANGTLLVGIDTRGQVRDIYYPYIGFENHVSGASGSYMHRIGVYADGNFAWLDNPSWNVVVGMQSGTLAGIIHAKNIELGVSLIITDVVSNEKNIFLREIRLTNLSDTPRTIKLFFAQQFRIAEDRSGSTGFYDPRVHALIHYKGKTTFLINARAGDISFDDYSVGLFNMESREGTYIDAEDGILSKNPIEHGSVDSVLGFSFSLRGGASVDCSYWIAVGETVAEVHALNAYIEKKGHRVVLESTRKYWALWSARSRMVNDAHLPPELIRLYEHSLLIVRAHVDARGGILASSDSDILNYGRDTYSYVWPRDAAIAAHALDVAGYGDVAHAFFEFILSVLEKDGYLMHKYRSDGALGSSWHPWLHKGKLALPIQEDETATVLTMLWHHVEKSRNKDFMKTTYHSAVVSMADFLVSYVDRETMLPKPSYDLWEEVYCISTYTTASVFAGLIAASKYAHAVGDVSRERKYLHTAHAIRDAIATHLFDEHQGIFYKYLYPHDGGLERNATLDSSALHGIVSFGVFSPRDSRVERMYNAVERTLRIPTSVGGYVRYERDQYYHTGEHHPPNPWVVTTMWIARYYIARARSLAELEPARELLLWAKNVASSTDVFPEQMNPETAVPLSATPLVWSHAEYILAFRSYVEAYTKLMRKGR